MSYNKAMRLFIAINLPQDVQLKVAKLVDRIKPKFRTKANFVPAENWHLTLCFLGNQPENSLTGIKQAIQDTALNFSSPKINFKEMNYGPEKHPYMVWLIGTEQTSKDLAKIKKYLENRLIEYGVRFRLDCRNFNAHLTLVRLPKYGKPNLPEIQTGTDIGFYGKSIDLMQSNLDKNGAKYTRLMEFKFK